MSEAAIMSHYGTSKSTQRQNFPLLAFFCRSDRLYMYICIYAYFFEQQNKYYAVYN